MAKRAPANTLDAMMDYIALSDREILCSAEPTTYAEATTTYALATQTLSGADFAKATGSPSGRKVTVAAKTGASVTGNGNATHVALTKVSDTTLRYVTTCPSQTVTSGNTANIGSWAVTVPDPT